MKRKILYPLVLCALALLSACVREIVSSPFAEPTSESLQKSLRLYVQIAYGYAEEKKYDRAMSSINRAFEIDQKSPLAITALAAIYQMQGEKEKAEKHFKEVLRIDPDYADAHLRYGNFLYESNRLVEACAQFEKASEYDFYEKRAIAFFNWGICLRDQQDYDQAEQVLGRYLRLQPKGVEAYLELAEIKYRMKDYPVSKQYYDRYVLETKNRGALLSARALWLGIRLERVFGNKNNEASLVLQLKNNHPYSPEYLEYKNGLK